MPALSRLAAFCAEPRHETNSAVLVQIRWLGNPLWESPEFDTWIPMHEWPDRIASLCVCGGLLDVNCARSHAVWVVCACSNTHSVNARSHRVVSQAEMRAQAIATGRQMLKDTLGDNEYARILGRHAYPVPTRSTNVCCVPLRLHRFVDLRNAEGKWVIGQITGVEGDTGKVWVQDMEREGASAELIALDSGRLARQGVMSDPSEAEMKRQEAQAFFAAAIASKYDPSVARACDCSTNAC